MNALVIVLLISLSACIGFTFGFAMLLMLNMFDSGERKLDKFALFVLITAVLFGLTGLVSLGTVLPSIIK